MNIEIRELNHPIHYGHEILLDGTPIREGIPLMWLAKRLGVATKAIDAMLREAVLEKITTEGIRQLPEYPRRVRLTEDYKNTHTGVFFHANTVLIRSPHGTDQYFPEGTPVGGKGVSCYDEIESISIREE